MQRFKKNQLLPINIRVEFRFELLHDSLPENVKLFVNVPNTYQNIFSISDQFPIKCFNVSRSENANGNMATI